LFPEEIVQIMLEQLFWMARSWTKNCLNSILVQLQYLVLVLFGKLAIQLMYCILQSSFKWKPLRIWHSRWK